MLMAKISNKMALSQAVMRNWMPNNRNKPRTASNTFTNQARTGIRGAGGQGVSLATSRGKYSMVPHANPKSSFVPHKPKRSATADKNAVASAMRAKSSTNLKEFSFCMTASSFSYGIGTIRFHTAWNVSHANETRRYGIWQFLLRGKNCYFDHDKR